MAMTKNKICNKFTTKGTKRTEKFRYPMMKHENKTKTKQKERWKRMAESPLATHK